MNDASTGLSMWFLVQWNGHSHALTSIRAFYEKIMLVKHTCQHKIPCQIALKAADLGHVCDPTPIHLQWVARLEEEFFLQGDAERAAEMPITPLFDRTKPGVTKSQVAFMDIVALPLYKAISQAYPGTEPFLEGVSDVSDVRTVWPMYAVSSVAVSYVPMQYFRAAMAPNSKTQALFAPSVPMVRLVCDFCHYCCVYGHLR
jgi:hypothetical protein